MKHVEAKHIKDVRKKCPHCDYKYNTEENMQEHINTVHRINHDIKCNLCNFVFPKLEYLENHMREGHNVQNFYCNYCGDTFNNWQNLQTHIKCLHRKKEHYCKLCNYRFDNVKGLQNHVNKVHNPANMSQYGSNGRKHYVEPNGYRGFNNRKDPKSNSQENRDGYTDRYNEFYYSVPTYNKFGALNNSKN